MFRALRVASWGTIAALVILLSACAETGGGSCPVADAWTGDTSGTGQPADVRHAPELSLTTCEGETQGLPADAGVVWLAFHTRDCPVCHGQRDELRELHERWSALGLVVRVVVADDSASEEELADYCRRYSDASVLPFPMSRASPAAAVAELTARGFPTQLLFDGAGRVLAHTTGWDASWEVDHYETLLSETLGPLPR